MYMHTLISHLDLRIVLFCVVVQSTDPNLAHEIQHRPRDHSNQVTLFPALDSPSALDQYSPCSSSSSSTSAPTSS
uniref:Secreted protein n=1 Tax=Oryza brachyantha TaxID=4533 RepID=J3LLG7_ORYBR